MLKKASNVESEAKRKVLGKNFNRNHSPFLKERDSNNSADPQKQNSSKKNESNALKFINEKNPTKNLAIRFNKKKSLNYDTPFDKKLNENIEKTPIEKSETKETSHEYQYKNPLIVTYGKSEENPMEKPTKSEEIYQKEKIENTKKPEESVKKTLDPEEGLFRDSDSKQQGNSGVLAANNVRGLFMNEHISKEEYLQSQDKKRKMKEYLENQIKEKQRKKDEEKRKEMELNKIEEERIKKELNEMENKQQDNPYITKKAIKQSSNEFPQNLQYSQLKMSHEKPNQVFEKKETFDKPSNLIVLEKKESIKEKEAFDIPSTPIEKRPVSEEINYLKKVIEDNTKLKDDKSKLQEEVDKKEEIINLLINVWNNNKLPQNSNNNIQKPPASQPAPLKPQIRRNKIPDLKKPPSSGLAVPKEDRILIEEKLRSIDNKIINARQKSLLLKNEKVSKLKEEYLKRVEDLQSKKSPYKLYGVLPEAKAAYRQYNSVPPKTTDNSYNRVTSMQEIFDEELRKGEFKEEKPARILKTSTPYKTNAQMLSQIRDQLNEDYKDFGDINSFRMIGNYINNTSLELKEKKVIQLNIEKNLANLKFGPEVLPEKLEPIDKKPMFPSIKSSIELKSRSEFMRLDIPLNNQMNKSGEDQNIITSAELPNRHIGYMDYHLTPNESKKMVFPSPTEYDIDNEFNEIDMDLIHMKSPSIEVKLDNEILVIDHKSNIKGIRIEDSRYQDGRISNNDLFNPFTTATSINTINTTAISKQRFPKEIFKPNLKKKFII